MVRRGEGVCTSLLVQIENISPLFWKAKRQEWLGSSGVHMKGLVFDERNDQIMTQETSHLWDSLHICRGNTPKLHRGNKKDTIFGENQHFYCVFLRCFFFFFKCLLALC